VSRFLFVVPPLAGHINPTVGVATALARRGHQVAWAGSAEMVASLVGPGAQVIPCATPSLDGEAGRAPDVRGPAALKFLWESFLIPLADAMAPGVTDAVHSFRPDVLVVDQQAVAGALVADRSGCRWATSATTSAELADPLAAMPKVASWLRQQLDDLRRRWDAPPGGDLRFSADLVLAFSTEELVGEVRVDRRALRFVGPSIATRPSHDDFPWQWLDRRYRTILITLGTVNADAGTRFLNECLRAMADRPWLRAVVVDPAATAGPAPPNVLLLPRVPQLELLPHVEAVVCHAGHNTTCESLFHGIPIVVAPIRDDQPIVAQQVVDAGAGLRLRFARASAEQVGAAIDTILADPAYREAARRIQQSFRTAGGAEAAAGHLQGISPR
jgi:MGT family glycosyltransferase